MKAPKKELIDELTLEARKWYLRTSKSQTNIATMRQEMRRYIVKRLHKLGFTDAQ